MRLLKIGRDNSCDIVLHSEKVSSLHAEITLLDSGDMLLEDKGSANGTFIMNQPVKPGKEIPIRRGDAIRFADVELQWSQIPMPEDNSAYKAVYGIGTNFRNDIQLSGATVSRYHATIKKGKDNKMYIFDHSKNGTTVDGRRIQPNQKERIKKKSTVVCGGIPVNLKNSPIQWPNEFWKTALGIAAAILILAGIGLGTWKFLGKNKNKFTDTELYAKYNKSVVMVLGIYHYEVSIGELPMASFRDIIPEKIFYIPGITSAPQDISGLTQKQYVESLNELTENKGMESATAFFISNDGLLLTNLHVVKPWLYDNSEELLKNYYAEKLARLVQTTDYWRNRLGIGASGMAAYISQIKVKGVMDNIALIPQGEIFDPDNFIQCRVVSAGDDKDKDVALIQTKTKRLPFRECTYVNVQDSLELEEEVLAVGKHIYTLGFPAGLHSMLQKEGAEKGIQVIGQGGNIIQQNSEFDFGHNAATAGGASGSPIFNEYGKLIGVHHAGFSQIGTQGFNYGVKAKYIKELLDSPHMK